MIAALDEVRIPGPGEGGDAGEPGGLTADEARELRAWLEATWNDDEGEDPDA